jgi:parallel beta-helix repeat protein
MPITGNEAAQAASPVDATIMADFANHISFVNCEVSQTGTSAFWFRKGCSNCMVQQCYLHELGAGGVKIGDIPIPDHEKNLTKRIRIDNNIIRSGGYVFPCAVGVTIFQASDNNITHNEIANFRYSGVSIGWVWGYTPSPSKRNIIEFNHIHHLGWGELCDMGGVYCLGQSEGTSVSNNLIHHVYSFDYGGWGLYTDEGSTGIIMENNLVYSCKNSGFHQHYGKENTIRNNIFAANIKGQLQATKVEEHLSFNFTNNIVWFNSGSLLTSQWSKVRINSDNNCYWDTRTKDIRFDKLSFTEWQASGKDTKSVVEDPKFVNPLQHDFRIQNKSMLKKIGFKPFDFTKAGVYGDEKWKKLAEFDPALAKAYDEAVEKLEKRTP